MKLSLDVSGTALTLSVFLLFSSAIFALECSSTCDLSYVTSTQLGDQYCDQECNTPLCNFDSGSDGLSDCTQLCQETGCDVGLLGNGLCDSLCLSAECGFDHGDCDCAPGCSYDLQFNSQCDEVCAVPDCDFDNYLCVSAIQDSCAVGCFPYMLQNGVCDEMCNNEACGYDEGDCECSSECIRVDNSTEENPTLIYVLGSASYWAEGLYSQSYRYLNMALGNARDAYTTINLLGGEITADVSHSAPGIAANDPIANVSFAKLQIQSLLCAGTNHLGCSQYLATINFRDRLRFTCSGNVVCYNVQITAVGFFENVTIEYCPYVQFRLNSAYDDRGELATEDMIAANAVCETTACVLSFFVVEEQGSLTFINVDVFDFTVQQTSVIWLQGGNVTLQHVSFTNIQSCMSGAESGVILKNDTRAMGSFEYIDGSVSLLNNGYEYASEDLQFSPFLCLKNLPFPVLSQVNFTYNNILTPTTAPQNLLYFEGITTGLNISDCSFRSNIGSGALISAVISNDFNSNYSVVLNSLTFSNNFEQIALIHLQYNGQPHNTQIGNCDFERNSVPSGDIINAEVINSEDISSEFSSQLTLSQLTFQENVNFTSLVSISNFNSIEFSESELSRNGDFMINLGSSPFEWYMSDWHVYMSLLPDIVLTPSCNGLVSIGAAFAVQVTDLQLWDNICLTGSWGFKFKDIKTIEIYRAYANGNNGILISTSQNSASTAGWNLLTADCIFESNDSTCVSLSKGNWQDQWSKFLSNSHSAVTLYGSNAVLADTLFDSNVSPDNGGGVFLSEMANMTCTNCIFSYNSAQRGGAVYIESNAFLLCVFCEFSANVATLSGSAVFISNSIDSLSEFRNSTFWDNASDEDGTSVVALGNVSFVNSTFTESCSINCIMISIINGYADVTDFQISQYWWYSSSYSVFMSLTNSTGHIRNSSFLDVSDSEFFTVASSELQVINSSFESQSVYGQLISATKQSSIILIQVYTKDLDRLMSVVDSDLDIQDSQFDGFWSYGVVGTNFGEVMIKKSSFQNGQGTLIYADGKNVTIQSSEFFSNIVELGDLVYIQGTNVTIQSSKLSNNTAQTIVKFQSNYATIQYSEFSNNSAQSDICNIQSSNLTIQYTEFSNNTAQSDICNIQGSSITFQYSDFSNNTAQSNISNIQGSNITFQYTEFSNNTAQSDICNIQGSSITFQYSDFSNNTAQSNISNIQGSNITFQYAEFSNNTAQSDICNIQGSNITFQYSDFSNNTAQSNISNIQGSNITFQYSEFSNNTAQSDICNIQSSNLTFQHTEFSNNTANDTVCNIQSSNLTFQYSEFSNNTANDTVCNIQSNNLTFQYSEFSNNTANYTVCHIQSSSLTFQYTEFSNNTANDTVCNIQGNNITIQYSEFSNNTAQTGRIINVHSISTIMQSLEFSDNTIVSTGDVVDVQGNNVTILSSNFFNNLVQRGGVVYLLGNYATIFSSHFYNNFVLGGKISVTTMGNNVAIQFSTMPAQIGGGIVNVESTNLTIFDSRFSNNSVQWSGCSVYARTTNTNISYSEFFDNYALEGHVVVDILENILNINSSMYYNTTTQGIINIQGNYVTIFYSKFLHNIAQEGGAVYINASKLTIFSSEFSNNNAQSGGALFTNSTNVIIQTSVFNNNSASVGGAVYANLASMSIFSSNFFNNTAQEGGAVFSNADVSIFSSIFTSNNATSGGAVYANSTSMSIFSSDFTYNTAQLGGAIFAVDTNETIHSSLFSYNKGTSGGATYSRFLANWTGTLSVIESTFTDNAAIYGAATFLYSNNQPIINGSGSNVQNNTASYGGGVVWLDSQINPVAVSQLDFGTMMITNNSASYGPNIASFPANLEIVSLIGNCSFTLSSDYQQVTVYDIVPGHMLPCVLQVRLKDHQNQVYTPDSSSFAIISSIGAGSISGTMNVTAVSGTYTFSAMNIGAIPGTTVSFSLQSSLVNNSGIYLSSLNTQIKLQAIKITFQTRECVPGEYRDGMACLLCLPETYGFNPSIACQSCPSTATCYGGTSLAPNATYWRPGNYSELILSCPNPAACLGPSDNPPVNHTKNCSEGYKGNGCQSCQSGYSHSSTNVCGKCPDMVYSILRIIGCAVLVLLIIVVIVVVVLRTATRRSRKELTFFKLMMFNFIQLISPVFNYTANWPELIRTPFTGESTIGVAIGQFLSIDCLLTNFELIDYYFKKMLIVSLIPVVLTLLATLCWSIVALINRAVFSKGLIGTFVVVYFMMLSSIMKELFSALSCVQALPGEYWLTVDMDIKCMHPDIIILVFPSIIIWGIAVPLLSFGYLYANRRKLQDDSVKFKLGFLTGDYKDEHYYWDFVLLIRKCLIAFLSGFYMVSSLTQALTVQLTLFVFLGFQFVFQPYFHPDANSMELYSLLVANISVFCCLFYFTSDVSTEFAWVLFVIASLTNVCFFAYWIREMRVLAVFTWIKNHIARLLNHCFNANEEAAPVIPDADHDGNEEVANLRHYDSENSREEEKLQVSDRDEGSIDVPNNSLEEEKVQAPFCDTENGPFVASDSSAIDPTRQFIRE